MTQFVLVHGAFHGGWCWDPVAQLLREQGHQVEVPDLPGAPGEGTPHEDVTFAGAVRAVTALIDAITGPVVLVGHSNGGMLITQAAAERPERVRRLAYLAAFRPAHGESLLDLTSRPEGAEDGVQSNVRVEGPSAHFDASQLQEVFAADCSPEIVTALQSRIGPQPLAMFTSPVQLNGTPLPPTTYVMCTQDRAIPVALQQFMADRAPADVRHLATSHSPYYSRPADVVEILTGTQPWAAPSSSARQRREGRQ